MANASLGPSRHPRRFTRFWVRATAVMGLAGAKFTGEVGLCYATSGPGAIHLLNGLYDAKLDHMPVVAIVGQQSRMSLGASYQQEVDLQNLFKDVAGDYVMTATLTGQVRHLIDRAVRIARTLQVVTTVIVPHKAAAVLNAGIAKALLGKAAVPDDLAYVTGSLGLLGTKPSWDMLKNCDTFFVIGSCFPYSEFLPKPGDARGVQIDIDGRNLSHRYPMEVNIVGDAASTLRKLLPMLEQNTNSDWRATIEKNVAAWWKTLEARAMQPAEPLNPQRVFWELSPKLPENCILTADSGSVAN